MLSEEHEVLKNRVTDLEYALTLGKNLAINVDDFLSLTYRLSEGSSKEIGGGILTALRNFRKQAENILAKRS